MDKKCRVGDAKNSKYDATACPKTVKEMEAAILKQVRLSFTKVKWIVIVAGPFLNKMRLYPKSSVIMISLTFLREILFETWKVRD